MKVLHGHTTPETAHITFEYPFGHNRCIRREWLEFKKGHGFRLVTQTTVRPFNYEYTERLERDGADAANAWAEATVKGEPAKSKLFNAAKPSCYATVLAIMTEEPLKDDSGRVGVTWHTIGYNLEQAERLKAETEGQLDEAEQRTLDAYIVFNRASNAAIEQAKAEGKDYPETAKIGIAAGRKALQEMAKA